MSDLPLPEPPLPVVGRRRGRDWVRVGYGLYQPVGVPGDLDAWQLVLPPSGRFTHLTAAAEHGWQLPPRLEGLPRFVAMSCDESRPQRPELKVVRRRRPGPAVTVDGRRLDPPAEVLLACARDLSLLDLVVLLDSALHLGSVALADLHQAAAPARRGAPQLRRALAFADGRSESAWETMLRMLHVVCDVPVEPQYTLTDEEGLFVARADLWVCGTNALHEYDGADHLSRRRQRKDLARGRRIGNQTWVRRGYTSPDVLHRAVGILRDADLSLGREHRPDRIRAWHALLADSLFTDSGQARLRRRLGCG